MEMSGDKNACKKTEAALIRKYNSISPNGYNLRCGDTEGEIDEGTIVPFIEGALPASEQPYAYSVGTSAPN